MMPLGRVALAMLVAGASACTYEWPVGAPEDSGQPDVNSKDAGGDRVVIDVREAAPPDVGGPETDAADCAVLGPELVGKRTQAKKCIPNATACLQSVNDECACRVWVGEFNSSEANAYAAAVSAFLRAGCHASCGTCTTVGTTAGLCVLDGTGGTSCSP
jgi:hypothetical protein